MLKDLHAGFLGVLCSLVICSTAVAGPSGALHFSGNDWIEVPDSPGSVLDVVGSVTLEAWVRFENYPNCCWNSVAGKTWSQFTEQTSYWFIFSNLEVDPTGNSAFGSFGVGGGAQVHADATPIRDNNWHHLAIVLDDPADETRLYIDGLLVSTGVQTDPIPVTDFSFFIATAPGHDRRTFEGDIDEVRLWNLARSSDEILNTKNHKLSSSETGLIGYWDFNEGTGDTAHDATKNHNDGFFVGSPTWISDGPSLFDLQEPPALAILVIGLSLLFSLRLRSLRPTTPRRALLHR